MSSLVAIPSAPRVTRVHLAWQLAWVALLIATAWLYRRLPTFGVDDGAGAFYDLMLPSVQVLVVFMSILWSIIDRNYVLARTAVFAACLVIGLAWFGRELNAYQALDLSHVAVAVLIFAGAGALEMVLRPWVIRTLPGPADADPVQLARAATHEAGHVLLCAANPRVHSRLSVRLREDGDGEVLLRVDDSTLLANAASHRWCLQFHLAGLTAERLVHGDDGAGAAQDLVTWERLARDYLSYGDDANAPEAVKRERVLQLRYRVQAEIANFLERNRPLLSELSNALAATRGMGPAELAPYLDQVVLTDGVSIVPTTHQEVSHA